MSMLKIAVIGSAQTVMGFKALGLVTCPAANADEARVALKNLTAEDSEVSIIYIEENLSVPLKAEIDKFKDSPTPAIILIPGRDGSSGLGLSALNAAVERAVGTNILGD
ncbi:MAG: V-type ATP synthase subunit F [Oscillospiraceae bacterium]|nr:V-type ATP synthase subunit F [Oscillospiraceae bacterium]